MRLVRCAVLLLGAVGLIGGPARGAEVEEWIQGELPELVALYREFHTHPELSFHEEATAARVAEAWRAAGAEVTEGVGGHGVVGVIRNGQGPTLMLRTDLDALPVTEATGLAFASSVTTTDDSGETVGVMHACGHDIHMTSLIGVARFLAEHPDRWQGTLVLVGQPAEERGAGAKAMLDDGLFTRFPKPDFALALHVAPNLPAGKVAYREGYSLANVDSVDIVVKGVGGHGAYPHMTIDPIVQAAQLIVAMQTIVSREIDPVESAVVTVGAIQGGTKHNVIPDECHLQLTVRSYTPEVRTHLLEAIERMAKAVAQGARAPEPEITVSEGTPAVYNDPALVRRVVPALEKALGQGQVLPAPPTMGGEDFSQYGRAGVPSFMFWLGSVAGPRLASFAQRGQTPPSLHSATYYPDAEPTLTTGISATVAAALAILATDSGG